MGKTESFKKLFDKMEFSSAMFSLRIWLARLQGMLEGIWSIDFSGSGKNWQVGHNHPIGSIWHLYIPRLYMHI